MTEPQPQTCSREFPGTVAAASEAENWAARQASAFGIGEEAEFAIGLCLEELFLNAVQHGHANHATISVCAEPNEVVVEFADDGEPFDPTLAPQADQRADRGFRHRRLRRAGLMQKLSQRMSYSRSEGMNRLTLEFAASS